MYLRKKNLLDDGSGVELVFRPQKSKWQNKYYVRISLVTSFDFVPRTIRQPNLLNYIALLYKKKRNQVEFLLGNIV